MAPSQPVSPTVILMAIRLVQPGRLSDIAVGIQQLLPYEVDLVLLKKNIRDRLEEFRKADVICLYAGQRYMLRPKGREIVERSGLKVEIDDRRMFLLKETRRDSKRARSVARDRSL